VQIGSRCELMRKHYPGNLAILLRNAPQIIPDGEKSEYKAFHVVVLVTPDQKSGEDGESAALPG
jgi:antiviral helicase SKI2